MSASRRPGRGTWLLLLLLVLGAAFAGLLLGPVATGGPLATLRALGGEGEPAVVQVVRELRLPRVLLGLLVGASLAVAGVLLQAVLRNDLAEPYIVGVGPGAFLGVTVGALVLGAQGAMPGPLARTLCALGGAVLTSLVIFGAAGRRRLDGPTLLLAGVALGAFVTALATAILYVAVPEWHRVVYWLLGHLGPRPAGELLLLLGALALAGGLAWLRARALDAIALGEEGAWLLGVATRRLVGLAGLAACVLAAAAVAMAGLIGFVGLLVPHLARGWVGPGHARLLPAAALLGGALLVLADALARTVHPPLEVPVGVVTAALGAPVLALLLLGGRRRGG